MQQRTCVRPELCACVLAACRHLPCRSTGGHAHGTSCDREPARRRSAPVPRSVPEGWIWFPCAGLHHGSRGHRAGKGAEACGNGIVCSLSRRQRVVASHRSGGLGRAPRHLQRARLSRLRHAEHLEPVPINVRRSLCLGVWPHSEHARTRWRLGGQQHPRWPVARRTARRVWRMGCLAGLRGPPQRLAQQQGCSQRTRSQANG